MVLALGSENEIGLVHRPHLGGPLHGFLFVVDAQCVKRQRDPQHFVCVVFFHVRRFVVYEETLDCAEFQNCFVDHS
jgi:hypothetical protein